MAPRFGLASGTVVAGMLSGQCTLVRGKGAVNVAGRRYDSTVGAHSCGRCRAWPRGRLTGTIRMAAFATPTVVVTAMAHSTAAAAESKKRQCAYAECEPNPVAAKPVHRRVPSAGGAVLARHCISIIHALEDLCCGSDD